MTNRLLQDEAQTGDGKKIELVHISFGGPDYWMRIGAKQIRVEVNPYFGPVVLGNKTGDPLEAQPNEHDLFWSHYEAWVRQGKRHQTVGGKKWCIYETDIQAARRVGREASAAITDAQIEAEDSLFGVVHPEGVKNV